MLTNMQRDMYKNPYFYSNWSIVEAHFIHPPYEVAILGKGYKTVRKEMDRQYLPQVLFLGGNDEGNLELLENKLIEGQTTISMCQDKLCKMPVTEVSGALDQLGIRD